MARYEPISTLISGPGRRALINAWVGFAVVAVSALQCAGAAAAPMSVHAPGLGAPEPTIQSQVSVDGVPGGQVPAPPADVMGTPAASTLVQSDQLYMTKIPSSGPVYNQWAKVDPLSPNGGLAQQGGYGAESTRPLLNPNEATAAGRFLDPVTARVLSLKLTKLASDGLLRLSSNNATREERRCCRDSRTQFTF